MRYGFLYLLSHEAATGQQHPLLAREGVRNTAMFPLVFCPYGRAAGFGDSNSFTVLPFHYRTMERLGLGSYVTMLDEIAALDGGFGDPSWPAAAMYGLLGPTTQVGRTEAPPADKLLAGIEWGYMSDGLPQPKTFMSIRGGSADVPHGHADLMAFWFQVADEEFLVNVGDGRYLDTTFSPVRYELYGCGPLSKNSILLNGVGIRPDSTSRTCSFEHEGRFAIQVDATQCFTGDYQGRPTVERCCRTFVNLGDGRYVIVDRVRFSNEGQFEARFHTFLPLDIDGDRQVVTITGERATVRLRFACNEPVAMRAGLSTPILPQRPADTILQVQSEALVRGLTLVTLIEPAAGDEALAISEEQAVLTVKLAEEVLLAVLLDGNGDPFGGASMD